MTDGRILFSKKAAADMLDLSVRTVDYLLASGELEYRKIGRKVLIPHFALTRFAGSDHSIVRKQSKIRRASCEQPTCGGQPASDAQERQESSAQNRGSE